MTIRQHLFTAYIALLCACLMLGMVLTGDWHSLRAWRLDGGKVQK